MTVDNLTIEFMEKFGASRDPALWVKLVKEELGEAQEAMAHLLKELADLLYVLHGLEALVGVEKAKEMVGDEVRNGIDRLLTLLVDPNEMDAAIGESHRRVHASNLSKLGPDGKPIRREDGKILKGPNYQPPQLLDLVTG